MERKYYSSFMGTDAEHRKNRPENERQETIEPVIPPAIEAEIEAATVAFGSRLRLCSIAHARLHGGKEVSQEDLKAAKREAAYFLNM